MDYHGIAIDSYASVPAAIEDGTSHNLWNREYNFQRGMDTKDFYYDWIRVIKILHTFLDYFVKAQLYGTRTNLPYSLVINSNLGFDNYAIDGIRIVLEKHGNEIVFSSNLVHFCFDGKKYPFEVLKQQYLGLQDLYEASLVTFWDYYNNFIDRLGAGGIIFKKKCGIIAQGWRTL